MFPSSRLCHPQMTPNIFLQFCWTLPLVSCIGGAPAMFWCGIRSWAPSFLLKSCWQTLFLHPCEFGPVFQICRTILQKWRQQLFQHFYSGSMWPQHILWKHQWCIKRIFYCCQLSTRARINWNGSSSLGVPELVVVAVVLALWCFFSFAGKWGRFEHVSWHLKTILASSMMRRVSCRFSG